MNKPGTAQVSAKFKAQKQQKELEVSKYSLLQHVKHPNIGPIWRAREMLLDFSSILSEIVKLKGGP